MVVELTPPAIQMYQDKRGHRESCLAPWPPEGCRRLTMIVDGVDYKQRDPDEAADGTPARLGRKVD